MKFRDWIEERERKIDEINRGLQRQFRQQNQHVPLGVLKDIEHQRLGNMWRKSQPYMQSSPSQAAHDTASQSPYSVTIDMVDKSKPANPYAATVDRVDTSPSQADSPYAATIDRVDTSSSNQYIPQGSHDSVSSMMQDDKITGITDASWEKKPRVIEVTPSSFDERTNDLFSYTRFGFNHFGEVDKERHARAAQFVKERGEKNQPIIVIQLPDGRFQLQEGFHRTMQYLLSGAPRRDWFKLKSGEPVSSIDFSAWKPVRLRAYIGHQDGQRQSLDAPPNQTQQPAA